MGDAALRDGSTNAGCMPDWLMRRAAIQPDRPAVVTESDRWTFARLDRQATTTARRLASLGVVPGDRVALLLGNGLAFVVLVHAIARRGAVLVPLNTRLALPELVWQLGDCDARLLVCDEAHAATAQELGQAIPHLRIVTTAAMPSGLLSLDETPETDVAPAGPVDLTAIHSIIYTSGTTGRPKGAQITFGNHWWSAIGSALNLGLHHDDGWLAVLPLFHVGGLAILWRSVIYGIPAIVHTRFDAAAVNQAIDSGEVTIVSVVSAMLQRMLDARGERPYPPSLRCVLLGGGPAPRPLLDRCAHLAVPVVQTYGLTEAASQVATLAPADALRKLGSAGQPLLPTEVQIAHDGAVARPGEIGEIIVRGPTVTPGYYNRPDATTRALRDGWLHTGDLGYLDDEGYLYVVDRRDDLIVSGGENVYPAEVEAALLAHPAVAEAGVTGVPDARWGQAPVAAVVLRPGAAADANALQAHCAARLARYKVPERIEFVAALPRNAAGKLMRHVLRTTLIPGAGTTGEAAHDG